ncbi:MFS transporter [Serratia sp. (in: enterobacteria)]|uniref:MFS transporter n=1 Tax=Serratia sp. (in: enterobacteria) TaxID=616 RepID=UPI003988CDA9
MDSVKERKSPARAIVATTLGNGLEFFDLVLYAFFATYIAKAYFPATDPLVSMAMTFLIFGMGYLARPLGALVIGHFADKKGRKPAMTLTFLLMGLSTLTMGITPSYASIGIAAPIIITLARLIQGFSAGGELGASTTLLVEYAKPHNRGFYGGWQVASQGAGNVFAAMTLVILVNTMPEASVEAWGWRIPFLFGIVIVPVGLYIRFKLEETATHTLPTATESVSKIPLLEVITTYYKETLAGILLTMGGTIPHMIIMFYIPNYAISILKLDTSYSMLIGAIAGLITFIGGPLAGMWSDKVGRVRLIARARIAIIVLIYPAFYLLSHHPSVEMLFAVMIVLSIINIIGASPSITILPEIFPRRVRTTGLSLVYSVAVGIFGGFSLSVSSYLIKLTGNTTAPAFYVIAGCVLSLFAFLYIKETSQEPLN